MGDIINLLCSFYIPKCRILTCSVMIKSKSSDNQCAIKHSISEHTYSVIEDFAIANRLYSILKNPLPRQDEVLYGKCNENMSVINQYMNEITNSLRTLYSRYINVHFDVFFVTPEDATQFHDLDL